MYCIAIYILFLFDTSHVMYMHGLPHSAFEPLAATLLSIHNLQYMNGLMERIREQIMRNQI